MPLLRRLAAIGIALTALTGPASAAPADGHTVRLGIVVDDRVSPAARYLAATIAEADTIWRPHGVTVILAGPHDFAPGQIRLTLTFAPSIQKAGREPGLGSIWFDEGGVPVNEIAVDLAAVIARIAHTELGGRVFGAWPAALAAQMTGRAIGRVVAHEIGHYLLASPAHARKGLMQAVFNGRALAGWDRRHFELDGSALPRLRARLAHLEGGETPLAAARRPVL